MTRAYPAFPLDPSDEELARDWTLTAADMIEIRRCRRDDNRHRFALQLCALRTLGRFADSGESLPVRIVNHVGAQLGLPATLFVKASERAATDTDHAQRIRAYLGYRTFDEKAQHRLETLLAERGAEGLAAGALLGTAVDALRAWRTEIPAASTLERLAASFAARGEQMAWESVHARLPAALCAAIDGLIEVDAEERVSKLHLLKQGAPEARPKAILAHLDRATFLHALDLPTLDLGDFQPESLANLAGLARRYDANDLRRIRPHAKRYAMVACLLLETQKTVLDQLVEMHRTYLLTLTRHAKRRLFDREHQAHHRARRSLATVVQVMRSLMAAPAERTIQGAETWSENREQAYVELALPQNADDALARLGGELATAAHALDAGLDDNPFTSLLGDKLVVSKDDAVDVPRAVRDLKRLIETRLPRIRLEDLLVEVDAWCGFTRELAPFHGATPSGENHYAALLAALVAHGTNLGIATMAQSTKGVSVDVLQHVSRWYLGEDALKSASRVLVDYHHGLPLSATWGDGQASSSDGQRFGVQQSSLIAAFYPRYFGYYDRAITVYTHQSDQWSVYGARAISCAAREATYVLDGLLENDTVLDIREHYTDTHGSTEHLSAFAICSGSPSCRGSRTSPTKRSAGSTARCDTVGSIPFSAASPMSR